MLHKTQVAIRFRAKKTLSTDYPKFCIGMPVVRTVYGHVIAKFSRMGRLPHFLTHGAPLRASAPPQRTNERLVSIETVVLDWW